MPDFFPTRAAGLARLAAWTPSAAHYAAARNFVRPPAHDNVSRLSPYLQRRLILEDEVVAAVLAAHLWSTVEKFLQEVAWRTYWKGWLEHRPAAWARWRDAVPRLMADMKSDQRSAYAAACAGRTGLACFDAWAHELRTTGWLANHARMWFASIWIFTLRLPWELGAAFFWAYLKDGDAASNTLSWRWVAGLHTPGKTYLARADNIARYTEGRFTPGPRELAAETVAITESTPLPRVPLWTPTAAAGSTAVDATTGWWLHGDDLGPLEKAAAFGGPTFAVWPAPWAANQGWHETVIAFSRAALADAAATRHPAPPLADVADLPAALAAWAGAAGLHRVIAWRPTVGPWAELATAAATALAARGITLEWRQRPWDTTLWPAATRGFFPFWQTAERWLKPPA